MKPAPPCPVIINTCKILSNPSFFVNMYIALKKTGEGGVHYTSNTSQQGVL